MIPLQVINARNCHCLHSIAFQLSWVLPHVPNYHHGAGEEREAGSVQLHPYLFLSSNFHLVVVMFCRELAALERRDQSWVYRKLKDH